MNVYSLIETKCDYIVLDDFMKFKEISNRQKILGEGSEKMKGILNWVLEWTTISFSNLYMPPEIIRSLREFSLAATIKLENAMFIPSLSKDQFVVLDTKDAVLFEEYFNKSAFLGNNYVGPCFIKKIAESKNLALIQAIY